MRNFNPRTREGCDATQYDQLKANITISIHAPARGATAILTKLHYLFYSYFTSFFLLFQNIPQYFFLHFTIREFFVQFFWCESPGDFLCAYGSHLKNFLIKSMSDLPQSLCLHQCVLPWFYTCFPDNRTLGCLCFHQ